MAKRQTRWAKRVLAELRELLGGRCVVCGTTEQLTFDCISPTGHTVRKSGKCISARASHYRQQLANGNLQLLCNHHNAKKGATEPDPDECPF